MMLSRRTKVVLFIAAVLSLAVIEATWTSRVGGVLDDAKAAKPVQAPVVEVDVAAVIVRDVIDWREYSGRLQAVDYVEIRALVPGTIMAVYFKDGALVRRGDPLFLIDPRPYVAQRDQASAQVAAARARARFATADSTRAETLIATNAIAKREFDEKSNAATEADANVKAAEAALATANVNLGYTRINAPVSGRISRGEITVGNVISAGSGSPVLTTLVSVSPIYANFDVDEQTYLASLGSGSTDIPVRLGLANETGYSREGSIASVDNQLNPRSGTIRVRATFANEDGALRPGLFARIAVGQRQAHPAILVDERAISTDQANKLVLVLDDTSHVQYRQIRLGAMVDGYRVVTDGLKPRDRIVVSGTQRVRPGDEVKPKDVPMSGEKSALQS